MIRKITCFSIQKNLPQYLGEQRIPKKSGLWWLSIEYIWQRAFKKNWSDFFFNWVFFSIWFNLKLESTGNYESTFLFFLNTSRRMCADSVDWEWPFTSLSRKSCPFARTHAPFSCEHYPLLGTYFPLLFLSSLGRKKKTAMAQWKQTLFWFFLYALKILNTGLGNCLNIRIIDVKDSLKFTLHKFYNPPSTTLHSCFFVLFWLFRIYHYSAEVLPCTTEVI